jgi:hypothetical protein
MAHSDWEKAAHAGMHLAQHALKGEHGKQVVTAVAGTALALGQTAAIAVAAPLLPILAVGGAVAGIVWWLRSGD